MKREKTFRRVKFHPRLIRAVIDEIASAQREPKGLSINEARVELGNEAWTFDTLDEFLAAYAGVDVGTALLNITWSSPVSPLLHLHYIAGKSPRTYVVVSATVREELQKFFLIFEEATPQDIWEIGAVVSMAAPRVFIGHGRNDQWQRLQSHLRDKHRLDVICFESGARAGHTIRDVLESMARDASIAFLVLTGEDKTSEDTIRARQNVVHECGLFQGRLGFDRGIMLVESGVELATNFDGIQQIRFEKSRIEETFGDVLATIRREFGPI